MIFFLLEDAHVVLGICFHVSFIDLLISLGQLFIYFSFLFILVSFDNKVMQVCGDIMGPRSWESI
jgi:hypothetical protein